MIENWSHQSITNRIVESHQESYIGSQEMKERLLHHQIKFSECFCIHRNRFRFRKAVKYFEKFSKSEKNVSIGELVEKTVHWFLNFQLVSLKLGGLVIRDESFSFLLNFLLFGLILSFFSLDAFFFFFFFLLILFCLQILILKLVKIIKHLFILLIEVWVARRGLNLGLVSEIPFFFSYQWFKFKLRFSLFLQLFSIFLFFYFGSFIHLSIVFILIHFILLLFKVLVIFFWFIVISLLNFLGNSVQKIKNVIV